MSILDRLAGVFRPQEVKINPAYAGMIMYTDSPKPVSMPKNYASYAKEGYRGDDTVYKCVSYIARNGAAIPIKLYTDASKEKEIESHPLLDRLNHPNDEQTGVDYLEAVISYLLISGNSYQYAIRASKNGPPDELWVLRPDYVQIIPSPTRGIAGYKYQHFDAPLDPANILHIKFWSPDNDLYGVSPLEVVAILVDQQTAAKKWNLALLQNNARPPGAWVVPTVLSKNERDRLEQKLKEKFQGYKNAGSPPVLDGGLQWVSMAHTPDDLDWLDSSKYLGGSIANIFNLPPPLVGDMSASTYNNMQEAKQASYTEAIFPTLDKIYAGWNRWLVPMYPDLRNGAVLGYDKESVEVVREIVQQEHKAERDEAMQRWQDGLATLNETREALGLEPVDGGDVYRVGSILVPAEKLMAYAEQSLSQPAAPPPASPEPLNVQPGAAPTAPGAPAAQSGSAPNTTPEKSSRRYPFVTKASPLDLTTKEQKRAYMAALELKRVKWEDEAARRLQSYFDQERQTVTAAIRNAAMPETADVWIEHALQQNAPDLKSLLVKLYQDVAGDVGGAIAKELKAYNAPAETKELAQDDIQQYLDMYGPDVLIYLLQLAGQKVQQINATTLAELQDLLHQGVLAGDSIPNLAQKVDSLYLTQIIPNRSTVIARTETIAASNFGSHEAAKQSGLALKKVWLATEDARTRPDHAAADGQEVDLDEPFTVGGAQLMYPGDVSLGAPGNEVIQCRCTQYYQRVQQPEAKHLPGRHDQATHGRRRTFAPKEPFHTTNPSDRLKEREATLTKACNAWQKKLNAGEFSGIETYTGGAYNSINSHLRFGGSTHYEDAIEPAKSGLLKSEAPFDMLVSRYVSRDMLKHFQPGKYFQDKGFCSTSIGENSGFGPIRLSIRVFKGAPGAYVAPISLYPHEKEWLIPAGAKFKVVSIENNHVVLEYKGTSFKKKKKSVEEVFMSSKKQTKADVTPEEQAILDRFNRQWESYVPDDDCHIDPDQMRKFTWEEGDLIEVDGSDEENDNGEDEQEENTEKRARLRRLRLEKLDN